MTNRTSEQSAAFYSFAKRIWLVLLLFASPVLASEELSDYEILSALGNDEYAVREAVTDRLLADTAIEVSRIDQLYAGATLPEQRHRLLRIARHHLLRAARMERYPGGKQGSLGVSIKHIEQAQLPDLDQPAIFVARTYAGFPAFEKLQVGDLILALNGQKPAGLTGQDIVTFLQNRITEHPAGETVRLTVRREGENIQVDVMLANMDALKEMYESRTIQEMALNNPMGQKIVIFPKYGSDLPLDPVYEKLWRERETRLEAAATAR